MKNYKIKFFFDNGFGSIWDVDAEVKITMKGNGEEDAEVTVLNIDGEPSCWKAIEEKAAELAFDKWDADLKTMAILTHAPDAYAMRDLDPDLFKRNLLARHEA